MKVLMIGAARDVKGGVSAVVNQYYAAGIEEKVDDIKYIATMKDGNKITKFFMAIKAYIYFIVILHRYDIVHVHMSKKASFYRKKLFVNAAKRAGKKIVIHMHSGEFPVFYGALDEKGRKDVRNVISKADALIVLSDSWKEFYSTLYKGENIFVVANGVMVPEKIVKDGTNHSVLYLGLLVAKKGIYDALNAIPNVLKKYPDAMFYFGGVGEDEKCRRIINEYGMKNHVKLLGWVRGKEKEKYLQECNTFILPSYHEGLPMSLLEAMANGCVVISTNVGGIPQVINANNGFMHKPGDVKGLYECICNSFEPDKAKNMSKEAYRTVKEQFNMERNLDKVISIYKKVKEAL